MQGFSTSWAARWAGAATVFMAVSRIHQHFDILVKISAMALTGLIALVLLAASASEWRPGDLRRHWIPKHVAVILAFALVGVPFALYPGRAFEFLNEAFSRTLLIAIITWAISRSTQGARFMAKVIATAGLAAIGLALHVEGINTSGRLSGAYTYDPNDLALVSIMTLPLVVWWITDRSTKLGKWLVLTLPVILWVIIRTQSRGGFLGLMAVTIGFLVLSFKWSPPRIKKVGRLVLIGILLGLPLAPGAYFDRMESITSEDDYNRTSPRGRIQVWKRGMGYAMAHPILGVGIHNFQTAEGWLAEEGQRRDMMGMGWKWSAAHNSFLQVTTELGFIPGIVFLVLVVRTIMTLTLWYRDRKRIRGPPDLLPPFLGLSFFGYAVTGFFLSFAYYDILYVSLGLASAVMLNDEALRKRGREVVQRRPPSGRRGRKSSRGAGRKGPAPAGAGVGVRRAKGGQRVPA